MTMTTQRHENDHLESPRIDEFFVKCFLMNHAFMSGPCRWNMLNSSLPDLILRPFYIDLTSKLNKILAEKKAYYLFVF